MAIFIIAPFVQNHGGKKHEFLGSDGTGNQ
jgi:hypothetical protein